MTSELNDEIYGIESKLNSSESVCQQEISQEYLKKRRKKKKKECLLEACLVHLRLAGRDYEWPLQALPRNPGSTPPASKTPLEMEVEMEMEMETKPCYLKQANSLSAQLHICLEENVQVM